MTNNDILIRLRYALNMKDQQIADIFKLGNYDVTIEEVKKILTKPKESFNSEDDHNRYIRENMDSIEVSYEMLDAFLNGFITYKRGKQEQKSDTPAQNDVTMNENNVNNFLLKKVKIALSLTSEEMLDLFEKSGISITKTELSAVLRREGQRNYKECGDRYARNFLKGLAVKYRN
jgi:uncharacterized protein YehS (DUF1456 family)